MVRNCFVSEYFRMLHFLIDLKGNSCHPHIFPCCKSISSPNAQVLFLLGVNDEKKLLGVSNLPLPPPNYHEIITALGNDKKAKDSTNQSNQKIIDDSLTVED